MWPRVVSPGGIFSAGSGQRARGRQTYWYVDLSAWWAKKSGPPPSVWGGGPRNRCEPAEG